MSKKRIMPDKNTFLQKEKARWFCIKTIVLIWCERGDLNSHVG